MKGKLAVALAAVVLGMLAGSGGAAHGTTAICGDSWGSDGHSGPWYTGSNQTLHGNTLVINCPGANTAWNVTYWVFKTGSGGTFSPIMVVRNGNGDAQWSVATSPVGCNVGWLYYTQVKNDFTGNYIRKPSGGKVIC